MILHLHWHLGYLTDAIIQNDLSEEREYRYSKDIHTNMYVALTIARVTHSPVLVS